jgi:hypothetical protein
MMALPTIFGMKFVGSVAIFANPQIFSLFKEEYLPGALLMNPDAIASFSL